MSKISQLSIQGMSCQSCANRIEKVLNKKSGILHAHVNFANESLTIEHENLSDEQLCDWIQAIGFQASPQITQTPVQKPSLRLYILWATALYFVINMILMNLGIHWTHSKTAIWGQFVLASIAQLILALPFYKSAWGAIKGHTANMDVLISLGTGIIWLYSSITWLWQLPHPVYFEASCMVLAFVSIGKYLENRVKKQSLNHISSLLALSPKTVSVKRQESWQTIPYSDVLVGDILLCKQGERIAADGIVIDQEAWCDESHLTGESKTLHKKSGDKVLAGALVSDGSLVYQAQQLGEHSLLGDMIKAVNEAQSSKAHIARFADKVASVFVPVIIILAMLCFAVNWYLLQDPHIALVRAVAVLVIACPCALGLATPAAIMAGIGLASKHGIWFKQASALEHTAQLKEIVFDKTGTLTTGKPTLHQLIRLSDQSLDEHTLLQWAASLEIHASHPIANAIIQANTAEILHVDGIHIETGTSIEGKIQSNTIKLGKPDALGITPPHGQEALLAQYTLVGMIVNDQAQALLLIGDKPKPHTKEAIQALSEAGIRSTILSGDQTPVVQSLGHSLGISQAIGNQSPHDKANYIQSAQHPIGMVGDGINDAVALQVAHVSFSFKQGTDVAQQVADVTLIHPSIMGVVQSVQISKATLKTIKQNLFFALIYNAFGLPLAAMGDLNPSIAGLAMALSSISVLLNALRLKYLRLPKIH